MRNIACLLIGVYLFVFTVELFAASWNCTRCVLPPSKIEKPLSYQFKEEIEALKLRGPIALLAPERLTYDFSQNHKLIHHDRIVTDIFTNTKEAMKGILASLKPDGVDEKVHVEAAFLAYLLSLKMALTHAADLQSTWIRTMHTSGGTRLCSLSQKFQEADGGLESSTWISNVLTYEERIFENDISGGLDIDSTIKNLVLDVLMHIKMEWNATLLIATRAKPSCLPAAINDANKDELKFFLTALSEERVLYWYYTNLPLQEGYRMLYKKLHESSELRDGIRERRKLFLEEAHANVIFSNIAFAISSGDE